MHNLKKTIKARNDKAATSDSNISFSMAPRPMAIFHDLCKHEADAGTPVRLPGGGKEPSIGSFNSESFWGVQRLRSGTVGTGGVPKTKKYQDKLYFHLPFFTAVYRGIFSTTKMNHTKP